MSDLDGVLTDARRLLGVFTEEQVRELGHVLNLPQWQTDAIVKEVFEKDHPND